VSPTATRTSGGAFPPTIAIASKYVDLESANQLFERALALEPTSVQSLLWLGYLNAPGDRHGYASALDYYRRAVELDPNATDAYIGIGMLHRAAGACLA
jgi:tetratricopeptide (TPR) repeat protein